VLTVPVTNYAPQSQRLDLSPPWTVFQVSPFYPSAALSPDGVSFMTFLNEGSLNGAHYTFNNTGVTAAVGSTWVCSAFFQAADRTQFILGFGAAGGASAFGANGAAQDMTAVFDTAAVTEGVLSITWPGVTAQLVYLGSLGVPGGNFWRASVTCTAFQAGLAEPKLGLAKNGAGSYQGVSGQGAQFWGLQLELGSVASPYLANNNASGAVSFTPKLAPTRAPRAVPPVPLLIPLTVGTPQTFSIQLGGVTYRLTLQYRNDPGGLGGWFLDVADASSNLLVGGIAVIAGSSLLDPYQYLGFGGGIYAQTTSNPDAAPTFANLGGDAQLYWVSP
jgi:hypothetical protein